MRTTLALLEPFEEMGRVTSMQTFSALQVVLFSLDFFATDLADCKSLFDDLELTIINFLFNKIDAIEERGHFN